MKKLITRIGTICHYRNRLIYFAIAIFVNIIFFMIFSTSYNRGGSTLYKMSGDVNEYVGYCENLINNGTYEYNGSYFFRMPGMAVIYMPLRLFFNQHYSLTFYLIIQIILSSLSVYYLALLTKKILNRNRAFYIVFFLYLFSSYVTSYNNSLYTESLAASLLIFFLYTIHKSLYESKRPVIGLIIAGLLFTWLVFLRPFVLPIAVVPPLLIVVKYMSNLKIAVKYILLFCIPFIVIDGLWTARNFCLTNEFVPLMSLNRIRIDSNYAKEEIANFIARTGLGYVSWGKNSESTWFISDSGQKEYSVTRPSDDIFPDRIFCGDYNLDSLKKARTNLWNSMDTTLTDNERKRCDSVTSNIMRNFVETFRQEDPFEYYIGARFRVLFKLLNQPVGGPFNGLKYPYNVVGFFVDAFINYFVFIIGALGIVLVSLFKFNTRQFLFFAVVPVFIYSLFALYYQIDERRFVLLAYPFLLIYAYESIEFLFLYKKIRYYLATAIIVTLGIFSYLSILKNISW